MYALFISYQTGFEIGWSGWEDADSGVKSFHYEVHPLSAEVGELLSSKTQSKIHSGDQTNANNFTNFTPPNPGNLSLCLYLLFK